MDVIIKQYIKQTLQQYNETKEKKYFLLIKDLFYSTHLKGPHIEFYTFPPSFSKQTLEDNMKKFQRKIVKSMNCFLKCEKYNVYMRKEIIEAMIQQLDIVLNINSIYWSNLGFDAKHIGSINKTYEMYKIFLQSYSERIIPNQKKESNKIFDMCFFDKTLDCSNYLAKTVQKNTMNKIKFLIKEITETSGKSFGTVMSELKQKQSEEKFPLQQSELVGTVMKNILNKHEIISNDSKYKRLSIPFPHKIKVKNISPLIEKWYYGKSFTFGRYLRFNYSSPYSYSRNTIENSGANFETIMVKKSVGKKFPKMFSNTKSFSESLTRLFKIQQAKPQNSIWSLVTQLEDSVKAIVDIGLNSASADVIFTIEDAKKFMVELTTFEDKRIDCEILDILANPASAAAIEFGISSYQKLDNTLLKIGFESQEINKYFCATPLPHNMLNELISGTIERKNIVFN